MQHSGMDLVITVDRQDNALGTAEKLQAHREGTLHRAFSVFVFNDRNELLLQQRAAGKYHSGGLWTNTCCSHPLPGEETQAAAHRRLQEEMGFNCPLNYLMPFYYQADMDNGLIEHEYDHIYTGRYNGSFNPDPEEVMAVRQLPLEQVESWVAAAPEAFTAWFRLILPRLRGAIAAMAPAPEVITTTAPAPPQKKAMLRLWNQEYPQQLSYTGMQDLDAYLAGLKDTRHYFLQQGGAVIGWAFSFERNSARWFGIIIDGSCHRKGMGTLLLDQLKLEGHTLYGWAQEHGTALKQDGSTYRSPLDFYRKHGFRLHPDVTLDIDTMHWLQISWTYTPYYIRRFVPADAAAYKALRLEALQTAPGVFGNSHATEAAYPENYWPERLGNPLFATFGLYHGQELIGITSIVIDKEQQEHAYLSQSFIRASYRGQGLSKLLYEARLAFARTRKLRRLTIGHRESNKISYAANQRYGFTYTHKESRTWPDGGTEDMLYYTLAL